MTQKDEPAIVTSPLPRLQKAALALPVLVCWLALPCFYFPLFRPIFKNIVMPLGIYGGLILFFIGWALPRFKQGRRTLSALWLFLAAPLFFVLGPLKPGQFILLLLLLLILVWAARRFYISSVNGRKSTPPTRGG